MNFTPGSEDIALSVEPSHEHGTVKIGVWYLKGDQKIKLLAFHMHPESARIVAQKLTLTSIHVEEGTNGD